MLCSEELLFLAEHGEPSAPVAAHCDLVLEGIKLSQEVEARKVPQALNREAVATTS